MEGIGGPGNTVTFGANLIVSSVDIFNDPELLTHEMGHVKQGRDPGANYLPKYYSDYREQLRLHGGNEGLAYAFHPMEIQANINQGLDPFWHAKRKGIDPTTDPSYWPSLYEIGLAPSSGPGSARVTDHAPSLSEEGKLIMPVQERPSDYRAIPDNVELMIPAEYAPGGVGVVGITSTNPSGGPANGGT